MPDNRVVWGHVINWAFMILMTIAAFVAVGMELMQPVALISFIVVLAVIQVFLQLYLFMHLKEERFYPTLFIVWGCGLGVIFAIGLWWMV